MISSLRRNAVDTPERNVRSRDRADLGKVKERAVFKDQRNPAARLRVGAQAPAGMAVVKARAA